mmetsp:Transcript_13033/g.46331  ORF Transcript_13033/g.46331 Transcript_13033/m.46331 type:complete len:103 (-) Transcript_13033:105-413(-)
MRPQFRHCWRTSRQSGSAQAPCPTPRGPLLTAAAHHPCRASWRRQPRHSRQRLRDPPGTQLESPQAVAAAWILAALMSQCLPMRLMENQLQHWNPDEEVVYI